MLKEELWSRRQIMANITVLWKNQVVEKTTLLEEIWQNGTKEQEVVKELKKEDGQSWEENRVVYIDRKIYMPNNWKLQKKII